jgi:hypothetical protein
MLKDNQGKAKVQISNMGKLLGILSVRQGRTLAVDFGEQRTQRKRRGERKECIKASMLFLS